MRMVKNMSLLKGKRGRKAGQGRFEGGRKPLPPDERRVNVTVKLPMWLRDWLQRQSESQGRIIEDALVKQHQITIPPGQE